MSQVTNQKMAQIINDYISGLKCCLEDLAKQHIGEIAAIIYDAYRRGKQVFLIGNGGSSSTASHLACDLTKRAVVEGKPRLRAISLTDNIAVIAAIANDIDYSEIFVEQLANLLNEGDVVIGLSVSGNSPNILRGIGFARKKGAMTIGLAGFGGGQLCKIADKCITLASTDYGQVEDAYLSLGHIVSYLVRERIINS